MDTAGEAAAGAWSSGSAGAPSESGGGGTLSVRDRLRAQLAKRHATIEQFGEEEGGDGVWVSEPPLSKRRLSEEHAEVVVAFDDQLFRTLSSSGAAPNDERDGGTSALAPVDEEGGDGVWDPEYTFSRVASACSAHAGMAAVSPNNSDGGDLHAELLECVDN
eukprot:CAMPEP_0180132476 /NCGR_PEP_ID=MMETSP0986-20121125/9003_1 /TAXON_ID=697907 /ORGANISM="non described non described, Strain CCMP2293" /LENGTH=161 /DNA_ID=CAMNT_0022072481 /DNA_START=171 /DNA_END=656 /DNA_ORIENTATION=+